MGTLVARHLVSEHKVRNLVLTSRSGPKAEGATELKAELTKLGAKVTIAACDTADKDDLDTLIKSIPKKHPLKAVVHTAGVIDDGTIDSLTPERIDTVLAPKVDAALNLHQLTKDLELSAFVLFSSMAATFGSPGQGNYAAANAFLDALAQHRKSQGLAATSLGWGLWAKASGMTGNLSEADLTRMQRTGIVALSDDEGLELFDAACSIDEALLVPAHFDTSALRSQARSGIVPPLLRGLVRVPSRRAVDGGSLARKLAGISEEEKEATVLEAVRSEVAVVLGHSSPEAVEPDKAFKELGFDSLAAVELRNRLSAVTGLRLPATLVFDYPTTTAVAGYLLGEVTGIQPEPRNRRIGIGIYR